MPILINNPSLNLLVCGLIVFYYKYIIQINEENIISITFSP